MHYEFPKTIAFSTLMLHVDQVQTKCDWSKSGQAYGVDSISRTTGVMYSDYFHLAVHTRFQKDSEDFGKTRLIVAVNIVWDKPCLWKSKIETETLSGIKKYYETFEKELMLEKTATGKKYSPKCFETFQKKLLKHFKK
jgi:hypothetical protein